MNSSIGYAHSVETTPRHRGARIRHRMPRGEFCAWRNKGGLCGLGAIGSPHAGPWRFRNLGARHRSRKMPFGNAKAWAGNGHPMLEPCFSPGGVEN